MPTRVRYIWASPNSLLGLLLVPVVLASRAKAQLVDGVLEIHGPVVSWILERCVLAPGGAQAMTLGHVVWGRDLEALVLTRIHERAHVRQYERWGPAFIPAYILASVWGLATGSGLYYGNFFERQALAAEAEATIPPGSRFNPA